MIILKLSKLLIKVTIHVLTNHRPCLLDGHCRKNVTALALGQQLEKVIKSGFY